MKRIKFEIVYSGAPYPNDCWWRVKASNGQIYVVSELMNSRNAKRVIRNIINAVKSSRYEVVEIDRKIREIMYKEKNK